MPFSIHEPPEEPVDWCEVAWERFLVIRQLEDDNRHLTTSVVIAVVLLVIGLACLVTPVFAHEHQAGESAERQQVVEFLRKWFRPKGKFAGIKHRESPCCYVSGESQDCFAVKQLRAIGGVFEVYPDTEGHPEYERWYRVDTGVNEDLQPDPRESPDGRSYVCIIGGQVACFVAGSGT